MTDYAIEVAGLNKSYRHFALRDVSFALPRGYIMGLIGPNGAGKTTIIKLLMNLVRRESGEIRLFGLDNRTAEVEVKSRVGFVYDQPGFWDDQSLDTQRRALGGFYPRWSDETFARLAAEFELPLARKYKTLSQGMKTKFALAMALSHEADLLVMDEPTTGLDPVFRRDLLKRLSAFLQDEGKSILFSTHITGDLERIADFVTFVRGGRLVLSMPTHELLDTWAVVRGDDTTIRALDPAMLRGQRRGPHSTEWLVSDAAAARRALGPEASVEKAKLDDVMVLMEGTAMLRNLLLKDLRLNAKVFWSGIPLLLWMGFALGEPEMSFMMAATVGALAGTLSASLIAAREDKFKSLALLHSLPLRRRDVVQARYVATIALGLATFLLVSLMAVVLPWSDRAASTVFMSRNLLFSVVFVLTTTAVMLPFALRFGMVGVLALMGALQFLGLVLLLWGDMGGGRKALHVVFGGIEQGLRTVYYGLDQPLVAALTFCGVAAVLWASIRTSVFLVEHQDY